MKALYYIGSLGIFLWIGILNTKWVDNLTDYYKLIMFTLIGVGLVNVRDYCRRKLRKS